jgi:hypothetical protein
VTAPGRSQQGAIELQHRAAEPLDNKEASFSAPSEALIYTLEARI